MVRGSLKSPVSLALALALALLCPQESFAQNRPAVEAQFRSWLEQTIWPKSRAMGVSRKTSEAAFAGVTLDWDLPDLVAPGSKPQTPKTQRQAEFGSPGAYFNAKTVGSTTETGLQMARKHAKLLAQLEARYGVPGHILLAIWGRESAYGRVAIKHNAFRVLGTKGFMSTRAPYFTDELLAALQIAEAGHVAPQAMKSSWAGALGQPQFMPTSFLKYAADGDGDGKDDIWSSEADTLASIAHYLAQHGWVKGRDWGFEITLPASVSCALEGPDQGRKIRDWAALGITRISGKPFPANEMQGDGFLMLPAGRNGPAFLVTPNFYVLKAYNMSDLYALFIGHIGDRIAYGAKDFSGKWGKVGGLYRSDVAAMQRALENKGHDVGGADGLPGFKTRRSIGRWQEASGQSPTCFPEAAMKAKLR
jgi:lytic murein transglycosylase